MARSKESTIVRSQKSTKLTLTRALFRTLEPVAPEVAGRLAARLWCTPPQSRPERRDPLARPGERFMVPLAATPEWATRPVWRPRPGKRFTVPATGRPTVVAETWGHGPTTILLHGWGGRRTQLASLVEPLVAAGQRVVALDAPGHGESGAGGLGGRRTTVLEIAEALTAVAAVTGPAHAIVAHSAGGNATALAVRDGLTAGRLVFVAPMASPTGHLHQFVQVLGIGERSERALLRRLERLVDREFSDLDVPARTIEAAELPPLLVIHDRHDREVGYADGEAITRAWPGARLLTTEGLGHRRILADPDVIDATVRFLTSPDRPAISAGTTAGNTRRS